MKPPASTYVRCCGKGRGAGLHGTANAPPPQQAEGWIDEALDRLQAAGLLDDRRYACLRAAALHRSGRPRRAIELALRTKGVAAEDAQHALRELTAEAPDAEHEALERYARRRRLGPFRTGEATREQLARERQKLLRAGFEADAVARLLRGTGDGEPG